MADTKSKRSPILTRLFIHDSEPNKGRPRAGLDVNAVVFKYQDGEETRVDLAQFFGGSLPAPSVGRAAAAFGINTSAGNTIGTLDREDDPETGKKADPHPHDVREAVEDRVRTFVSGKWTEAAGVGGPGTSFKMDTLVKFRTEVNGKQADEAWMTAMREKLEEDENFWKTLMQDQEFRAIHTALQAERAAARAKAAAESAKSSTSKGSLQI